MDFRSVLVTRSYEQVVQQIQDGIHAGLLAPGQRLPTERELAESFAVSRGVVREALKALASLGLVESRQGSGTYVRTDPLPIVSRALTLSVAPEEHSLARLFEFRHVLETYAAGRAAELRADEQAEAIREAAEASARGAAGDDLAAFAVADGQFHQLVSTAADNPYLAVTLRAVKEMQTDVIARLAEIPGSIAAAAEHHRRVAAAIAAGDAETAAAVMGEHIRYTDERVAQLVRATPTTADGKGGNPARR